MPIPLEKSGVCSYYSENVKKKSCNFFHYQEKHKKHVLITKYKNYELKEGGVMLWMVKSFSLHLCCSHKAIGRIDSIEVTTVTKNTFPILQILNQCDSCQEIILIILMILYPIKHDKNVNKLKY